MSCKPTSFTTTLKFFPISSLFYSPLSRTSFSRRRVSCSGAHHTRTATTHTCPPFPGIDIPGYRALQT